MKKIFLLFILVVFLTNVFAQLKSPEAFLGYAIGSRYTPHYQLVNYFKHVADAVPAMVNLQQYGETNEHRPLYLAFISSEKNMGELENIRKNNLRLANLALDRMAPSENAPALVWLSYNVHGNETSSSEAAMLTLYALADPQNAQTKTWLQNTVVIIDPCLNPDGRDRYVNWFNTTVGKNYNPALQAREHDEPWPGGRTNHYNFDLNRDWAWQTQVESSQRIAQYLQWMPQVHVDFHEQGVNQPYYFAPAAQPYHEVITKFQRDFQVQIGKNHAYYFDKNGWLFFTKEIFDLLYPSYGDTYPIYSGSIGMTYEQAGGPRGGLGAVTDEGDTLTLFDRATHHHTTGLSTIEVSSNNAGQLVKEFRKFFNDAAAGNIGQYKSYIIKYNENDEQRLRSLMNLLDKNGIRYGSGSGSASGLNYHTKKIESFSINSNDIVISAAQPRAAMVKVLFEPDVKLVDSATYDITAWAMPYVYGLQAYASTARVNTAAGATGNFTNNSAGESYGYVIKWQGTASAAAAAQLMQKDIKLRYAEAAFEANGQRFGAGSIIILKGSNEKKWGSLWNTVAEICNNNKVKMYPVNSGMVDKGYDFGSAYVHPLKAPRVVLMTGPGISSYAAGEIWNFFDNELKYTISLVNAEDFGSLHLNDIDVLIMPDGRYKFLGDKDDAKKLEDWIRNGGRVVALESAVAQLSKQDWSSVKSKNNAEDDGTKKDPYASLQSFDKRERDALSHVTPGAIFKVDVDNTHPLMFGYPPYYYTLKMDSHVYEFIKEGGWNAGVIKKENQLAGYVGSRLNPKLKDGLLFGVQELGGGTVTYLTDNVMFRNFWENGKLMLCNAVFLVGQ
ncbi:MAG: M14 metallopeptidase family protein [Ferruginibacter sp.]